MKHPTVMDVVFSASMALAAICGCSSIGIAQNCQETPRGQIETALDKTTNRILLREVVDDSGDEGKRILVQIAGDKSQPARRRGEAIRLLGEHRSEAGEALLFQMIREIPCGAIGPLVEYRSPELLPALIALLDDHRSCGNMVRFSTGQGTQDETEVFLSDVAVGGLERLTGKHLEEEDDLFRIGHRATQPWKDWWSKNQAAFLSDPTQFLTPIRNDRVADDSYPCSVLTVAVSPDGKTAFSSGKSYDPWVRAWNIDSRQEVWTTPTARDDEARSAMFSPDGHIVAMSTSTGAVRIFDAATGRRLRMLIIGTGIDSVAFSPDGTLLALGGDDGAIRFFNTADWCETKRLDNADMTEGIVFSPDGALLAAATFELVRLWDVAAGAEVNTFKVRPAKSPTIFADAGERDAQLWRMAWQVAFSPDGKLLASGSSAAVQLWNVTTGQEVSSSPSNGQVGSLHFTADGQWVIWGNDRNEIVKWNPSTGKKRRIKNEFSLGDSAVTADGKLILSPGSGTDISIFDLPSGRKVGVLRCAKPKQ